jgi:hypothetical protein
VTAETDESQKSHETYESHESQSVKGVTSLAGNVSGKKRMKHCIGARPKMQNCHAAIAMEQQLIDFLMPKITIIYAILSAAVVFVKQRPRAFCFW